MRTEGGDKSLALFQSSLYERNIYAPPEHKPILLDYHQRKVCFRAYIMQSVHAFTILNKMLKSRHMYLSLSLILHRHSL
jgi:hypothetical protein